MIIIYEVDFYRRFLPLFPFLFFFPLRFFPAAITAALTTTSRVKRGRGRPLVK